jgi:hypothetical protein
MGSSEEKKKRNVDVSSGMNIAMSVSCWVPIDKITNTTATNVITLQRRGGC